MFHASRGNLLWFFLFCAVLSSLSMVEAQVALPPNVPEAARLVAIPLPEPPAGGENPALPAEEVGFFLSLFLWCSAPSICCVCYAESRLAGVVLVSICSLFCRSRRICFLSCLFSWGVVLACKAAFFAYATFLMVSCFWPHVLSKLFSMACVAFKLPFYNMSVWDYISRLVLLSIWLSQCMFLSSCFHSVCCFQVAFWLMSSSS